MNFNFLIYIKFIFAFLKIIKKTFFLLFLLPFLYSFTANPQQIQPSIKVFFSPQPADVLNSPYWVFKEFIRKANKSLFVAAYDFNIQELSKLLVKKKKEGVYVELLIEKNNYHQAPNKEVFSLLKKNKIKVILDSNHGLMHNKYIIRDREAILTGSLNFTLNGFFHNYNDILIIKNRELANLYLKNYLQLTTSVFYLQQQKYFFHKKKIIIINQNEKVIPIFSKQDKNILDFFKKEINTSREKINFLVFAFSSKKIADFLISRLKKEIPIKGVFDDSFESANITKNWQDVPFQRLWKNGADVKYDDSTSKLHHKLIIIDRKKVLTGSFNFSNNALKRNNENFLIIQSKILAKVYQKRFNQIWKNFPYETEFEKFIRLKKKKKLKLNYNQYLKETTQNKNFPQVNQTFYGQVVRVLSANNFLLKLKKNNKKIDFVLSGIVAPIQGIKEYNQEPQFTLTKEKTILLTAQKNVRGKILKRDDNHYYGLLYLEKNKQKSLNETILSKGIALLDNWNNSQQTLKKNPSLWKKLRLAEKKAKQKKKLLWGKYTLKHTPQQFRKNLEEILIKAILKEKEFSENIYQKNYLIGNRKTKKVYPPYSNVYFQYLRNLEDKKLIFFKNKENAQKAGYEYIP